MSTRSPFLALNRSHIMENPTWKTGPLEQFLTNGRKPLHCTSVFKLSQVFRWKFINKTYLQMKIVRDYSLYLVIRCQALTTNGLQERIRLHMVMRDNVKFKCTHFKTYYSISREKFNCACHVQIWCASLIFLSQFSQSWS